MADVKISQLPAATTPVDGTEVLPIVQSATTKQVSIANLTAGRAMAASSLTLTTPLAVTSGGTGLATVAQGALLSATAADTISATRTPTLGLAGTAAGTLGLSGSTSGVVTIATQNAAGTWTLKLPTTAGSNGWILTTDGSGNSNWTNPTALGIDLDVGTTAITGGTSGRVLYNNAGVLGELANTGTGNNVLATSPTFTTSALFPDGSVSAPSIGHAGDTNTGIYFPANDTVAIATSGTEDMRFTPEGNVTLNSATFSPTTPGTAGNMAMTGTLAMGSSFLRNRIINGDMAIDQRNAGASVTLTAANFVYPVDRMYAFRNSGTSGAIAQRVSSGITGGQYALRIQRNNGNSATDVLGFGQVAETANSLALAGNSVTFSFLARRGANFSGSSNQITARLGTGNGIDQSSGVFFNNGWTGQSNNNNSVTLTTSWQTFSYTITAGSSVSQIGVQFFYTPSGTAGADDWFEITNIQVEVGSIATPFERRQYGTELMLCQRYFEQIYGNGQAFAIVGVASVSISTSARGPYLSYRVPKRVVPTIAQTGTYEILVGGTLTTLDFGTADIATSYTVAAITGTGMTAGQAITIRNSNDANAKITASAEL
jgi:hypothetical protein